MYITLDEQDKEYLNKSQQNYLKHDEIMVGDYVIFKDDTLRRVSHIWKDDNNNPSDIQTTDVNNKDWNSGNGGSYYLYENGYMSFSGGLYPAIPVKLFEKTDEFKSGQVWFFHHDYACRDNGVYTEMNFKVWKVNKNKDIVWGR